MLFLVAIFVLPSKLILTIIIKNVNNKKRKNIEKERNEKRNQNDGKRRYTANPNSVFECKCLFSKLSTSK